MLLPYLALQGQHMQIAAFKVLAASTLTLVQGLKADEEKDAC